MKIGLIGDGVADEAHRAGALEGIGTILARHFETLVASGAAVAAFSEIPAEFRQCGGQLIVALPPVPLAPQLEVLQSPEVRRPSTTRESLEALLGDIDALLCCPGGIATLHELLHFLDARLRGAALDRVLVYLHDRDKLPSPPCASN